MRQIISLVYNSKYVNMEELRHAVLNGKIMEPAFMRQESGSIKADFVFCCEYTKTFSTINNIAMNDVILRISQNLFRKGKDFTYCELARTPYISMVSVTPNIILISFGVDLRKQYKSCDKQEWVRWKY